MPRSIDPADRTSATWTRQVRLPAGLGCLLPPIALPLALLALVVALVHGLVSRLRGGGAVARLEAPQEAALRSFVRKMALDDAFSEDEARMAGLPADAGLDVDAVLEHAEQRGWIERRGEQLAVTDRGRAAVRTE